MSKLLCNVLKISGGGKCPKCPPPGCAPAPQHNSLNITLKAPLAAAIRYLIYKHITFLRHKVIPALPNATVFCIVVVVITQNNFE